MYLYVCMYVCVCVCMYVCMCVCVCMCVYFICHSNIDESPPVTSTASEGNPAKPTPDFTLPDIAKSQEARQLAGVTSYPATSDGSRDVDWIPTWDGSMRPGMAEKTELFYKH